MGNTVGSLSDEQHSIVVGTLLGDGAMCCMANALLEINHSSSTMDDGSKSRSALYLNLTHFDAITALVLSVSSSIRFDELVAPYRSSGTTSEMTP